MCGAFRHLPSVAGGVCGQRGLGAFVQWWGVKFCFSCGVKKRNTNARRVRRSRSLQQERGANSLARLIIRCGVVPKVLHNNMVPLCPRFHFFKTRLGQTNKQQTHKGWGGFLWRVKNKRRRCLSFLRSTMGCGEAAFWGRAKSRGRAASIKKQKQPKRIKTFQRRQGGRRERREKERRVRRQEN